MRLHYFPHSKGMVLLNSLQRKYFEIKSEAGARPSRGMMFRKLGKGFHDYLRDGWLGFLAGVGELTPEEEILSGTAAEEFLAELEKTVFDKADEIPVVLAFLTESGGVRPGAPLGEIGRGMMEFYHGSKEHQRDFDDQSHRDWRSWGIEEFEGLALKNPVNFLSQSMKRFFYYDEDNRLFLLDRCLNGYLNGTLAKHIRDIMEFRRLKYFKGHYEVEPDELGKFGVGQAADGTESYEGAGFKVYRKLIRDRIPEIIEAQGKRCEIRTLNEEEYREALDRKLREELAEYLEAGTVEELADLVEVALAIAKVKGTTEEEFERVRMEKKEKRGEFEKRLWLERIEE